MTGGVWFSYIVTPLLFSYSVAGEPATPSPEVPAPRADTLSLNRGEC
jgi:hypothetical protein